MHHCPECGQACYCGGDIDDCLFEGTPEESRCAHCPYGGRADGEGIDGDDDYPAYDGEERDEPQLTCLTCCCVIGDEVAYGDDWGEGPLCTRCAGMEESEAAGAVDPSVADPGKPSPRDP